MGEVLAPTELPNLLNATQLQTLKKHEETIQKGWHTFVEVGVALTVIRDEKLFVGKYKSFPEYCSQRWGYGRAHAYRLMDAAEVVQDVKVNLSPIGDNLQEPANEAQARELIEVPKKKRAEAWKKVLEMTNGKPLTAKMVREVAAEYKPATKTTTKKPAKKPGVSRSILSPALLLIDQAESAAQAKNFDKVQELLGKLRKQLAQY